jgi:hypothetical protein
MLLDEVDYFSVNPVLPFDQFENYTRNERKRSKTENGDENSRPSGAELHSKRVGKMESTLEKYTSGVQMVSTRISNDSNLSVRLENGKNRLQKS